MPLLDHNDLQFLENEVVNIVHNELEKQLSNLPDYICSCKECLLDVMTLALNTIKPLYRVTLLGKIYTSAVMNEKSYEKNIKESVYKAIEKVHKNPKHIPEIEKNKKSTNHFKQRLSKKEVKEVLDK